MDEVGVCAEPKTQAKQARAAAVGRIGSVIGHLSTRLWPPKLDEALRLHLQLWTLALRDVDEREDCTLTTADRLLCEVLTPMQEVLRELFGLLAVCGEWLGADVDREVSVVKELRSGIGVEGIGSYGAGVVSAIRRSGIGVLEILRTDRRDRRLRDKSDTMDAENATRVVLAASCALSPRPSTGLWRCSGSRRLPRTTPSKPVAAP